MISDLQVSWVLDSKKARSPRMFFLNEENKNIRNSTMRLSRGKTECRTERVYVAVSKSIISFHFSFIFSNRKFYHLG